MAQNQVHFMISHQNHQRTWNHPKLRNTPREHFFRLFFIKIGFKFFTFSKYFPRYAITTGTSVVGMKFDGGVVIAADTLISYGSLARYRDVDRIFKVNDSTIIGAGGDYADFQFIKQYIDQKVIEDYCYNDKIELKPKSLYNWLTRVLYNKRSRFDPLWIDLVIGGMQDGEPFLGHVDLRGRSYVDNSVATGYGKHFAIPYIRQAVEKSGKPLLNQNEANEVAS